MENNTPTGLFQVPQQDNRLDYISQLAKEYAQKTNYYRQLLGNDIIDRGMAQYGPEFITLLDQQISQNPGLSMSLAGTSGQQQIVEGIGAVNTPAAINARLGINQGNVTAGMSTMLVRMPDGSIRQMSRMYDVGYGTEALGGNVNIGGTYMPKSEQMPSMYSIQARYNRKF